jgi:cbb3-type cytochrome oxidase subunit 3
MGGTLSPAMTFFIFIGDMLVMAFMVVLVVWISLRATRRELDATARIPLEDEAGDG